MIYMRFNQFLSLIFLFLMPLYVLASEDLMVSNTPLPKGALCYIKADGQVVFVEEVFTRKLSLPGGTVEAGEEPSRAAERETWEETGLVVSAGDVLAETETAIVFHCTPDSGVVAFSVTDEHGFHSLPAWFAPDFGIEIQQVLLGYVDVLAPSSYRYPEQFSKQVLNHDVPNAPIQYIDSAIAAAPAAHQFELPLIEAVQSVISRQSQSTSNLLVTVMKGLNVTSSIFGVLFLLPIFIYFFGGKPVLPFIFISTMAVTITLLIQLGLKYPRPFIYQPVLKLTDPLGFSSPSIRAALSVVLIGYLFQLWRKNYEYDSIWKCLIAIVVITLAQGFSSIALGVQFISDVLFGYVIGLLVLWHYIRLEGKQSKIANQLMAHPMVWWGATVVMTLLTYFFHSIQLANTVAVTLAIAICIPILVKTPAQASKYFLFKLLSSWSIVFAALIIEPYWFQSFVHSSTLGYLSQCGLWFVLTFIVVQVNCIDFTKERRSS